MCAERAEREITSPNLILCEGPDDIAFFQKLIETRGLANACIRDTRQRGGTGAGNTKFGAALRALRIIPSFGVVRRILIVADTDDSPANSFASVREQLEGVFGAGSTPASPLLTQEIENTQILVSILMVPSANMPGNIETLCLEAARSANLGIAAFTDAYRDNTPVANWPSQLRRDEMWLRSNLAARCAADPFVFLSKAFREHPELIPLGHSSFNHIVNHLSGFLLQE
jgi:hypothetical protein